MELVPLVLVQANKETARHQFIPGIFSSKCFEKYCTFTRYTEKWLRRQTNLPPPDEAARKSEDKVVIESPASPVGSAANDSRIQSPTSVDSGSSNESLFAPPKAKICLHKKNEPIKKDYRHRRKIKKNHHSMIADDSPRLPTPPELRCVPLGISKHGCSHQER